MKTSDYQATIDYQLSNDYRTAHLLPGFSVDSGAVLLFGVSAAGSRVGAILYSGAYPGSNIVKYLILCMYS